jgi:hypothetical protein
MVSTKSALLVSVALDSDTGLLCGCGACMNFLHCWALLELQKGLDHLLAVVEDRPQFLPTLVACSDDSPQRDGFSCKFSGDR